MRGFTTSVVFVFGSNIAPTFTKHFSNSVALSSAGTSSDGRSSLFESVSYALGAGLTVDNSIKYVYQFGGLYIGAIYSFGNNYESSGAVGFSGQVPGHMGAGDMLGLLASYAHGPLNIGARVQQVSDNGNNKQTLYHVGIRYVFSQTKLSLGYMHSQDNTGLVDTLLAEQPIPDIGQLKNTGRTDDDPFAGVSWQVSGPLLLTARFTTITCGMQRPPMARLALAPATPQ